MTSEEWFEQCYSVYKAPGTRTKKGMALKSWKKINPDETLANQIFEAILAQNRYQKSIGESMQYNRGFQVWLNQDGWLDEIPSVAEKRTVVGDLCKCGKPAHPANNGQCDDCYYKPGGGGVKGLKACHHEVRAKLGIDMTKYSRRDGEELHDWLQRMSGAIGGQ